MCIVYMDYDVFVIARNTSDEAISFSSSAIARSVSDMAISIYFLSF